MDRGVPHPALSVDPKPMLPAAATAPIPFHQLVNRGISKPGRYLGQERGALHQPWEQASLRWCLTYPELYEVGASNLGHIILYGILNRLPGQLCDRAYLPAADLASRLRQQKVPLFAVESRRPLKAFDILGFSLSYELGATNILEMLDLSGLSLWARQRPDVPFDHPQAQPLIFAGGQTATSNPEPYAAFFDFIALGDGEELLPEIGLVVREGKAAGLSRSALLRDLAQVPGVYVPSLYQRSSNGRVVPRSPDAPARVVRRVADPIPHYATGLVPQVETVHDRLVVEIRRGCTRGCRFCQPGMLTRPARDVAPEEVVEAVETGMKTTGYSDFSLLSLSCSDYLALPAVGVELRNRLQGQSVSLSLPSQRVDRFDETIARIIGGARRTGVTFAPEAGTQRLRDIINKGLTDQDLLRGVRTAYEQGWRTIKLYFMIGLPGETDADVLGIAETVRWLKRECRGHGPLGFHLTISNFTPKPHTPFQWYQVSGDDLRRKQVLLRQALRGIPRLKVNETDVRISAMEDFVGRGDRRLAQVIVGAWRNGAGMDAWWESVERAYNAWNQAICAAGLRWKDQQQAQESEDPTTLPLPWDHVDTGVDRQWLREDLQRALEAMVVPDCSFAACSSCGVCGPGFGHNQIVMPPSVPVALPKVQPVSHRVQRLRLRFTKEGDAALLSHLDLLRLLERALRSAALPISFSAGFHPLPRLQVGHALPLGVQGGGELLDLELAKVVPPMTLMNTLQPRLPMGIQLLTAEEVPLGQKSLAQLLEGARWIMGFCPESGAALPGQAWQATCRAVLAAPGLPWEDMDKKGRRRQRDLRPLLKDLTIDGQRGAAVRLAVDVAIDPTGRSLKPEQLETILADHLGEGLCITTLRRDWLYLRPEATTRPRQAGISL